MLLELTGIICLIDHRDILKLMNPAISCKGNSTKPFNNFPIEHFIKLFCKVTGGKYLELCSIFSYICSCVWDGYVYMRGGTFGV